jgi:hypothetical protein
VSCDPLAEKYPFYTPYQYAGNQPINFIDLDGMEQASPPGGSATPTPPTSGTSSGFHDYAPAIKAALNNVVSLVQQAPPSASKPTLVESKLAETKVKPDRTGTTTPASSAIVSRNLPVSKQVAVSADTRSLEARNQSEARAATFFTTIEIANRISSLPIIGGVADPLVSSPIRAGAYDAMGMSGQRNAELTNAAIGIAVAFVTEGIVGAAAKGSRAFFSGAGTEAQALSQGLTTLGQTRAGQNLAKLTADMPYYPGSQAYQMWGRLSTQWAKGASGEVHVFQNAARGVDLQSIWRVYEYPALKANPNVTNIIFHY